MLVVVAGHGDLVADRLLERWAGRGAARLAPSDLSAAGWRHHVGGPVAPGDGSAVVGGQVVSVREITGVVTRMPAVFAEELDWVEPLDRAYVAAEMTAFLAAWLGALACPVLNRPAPGCLAGPNLTREQWALLATRAGVPARPVCRRALRSTRPASEDTSRHAVDDPAESEQVVTVVGERCVGADDRMAAWSLWLARAARAELLAVRFEGVGAAARFVGASPWPDVSRPDVADALAERIEVR